MNITLTKDKIICGNAYELIKQIPSKSIDLIITDPPYEYGNNGGGCFGTKKRKYHKEYLSLYKQTGSTKETERLRISGDKDKQRASLSPLSKGIDLSILDEFCRVLKKINIYIWCSKAQIGKIINYFENKKCNIELITWHKTNPIPACNNTYLSDTEYCIFAREKGVKLYGNYYTKKKYYVTPCNVADKKLYCHPTIKPLEIIQNLIINSSNEGDIILDPFIGSGTTAVACANLNRNYIGFEIEQKYVDICNQRLKERSKI